MDLNASWYLCAYQEAVLDDARRCFYHPAGRIAFTGQARSFLSVSFLDVRRIMGPMLEIKSYFRAKRRDLYAEKMKFCSLENAPFYNTDIHCHVGIVHEKGHPLAMDCRPSPIRCLITGCAGASNVCSLSLNLGDVASQK